MGHATNTTKGIEFLGNLFSSRHVCPFMRHPLGLRIANIFLAGASGGGVVAAVHFWIRPLSGGPDSAVLATLACLISLSLLAVAAIAMFLAVRGSEGTHIIQTGLSLCLLLTFPVGTVYSLYTLWACWGGEPRKKHSVAWPEAAKTPNQSFRFVPR